VADARAVDQRIAALRRASEEISDIVRLLSVISQQSRILALNAHVEAARAGEVGRGFAVVAEEVKQLADRTARAAGDIGAQVGAVQDETRSAVDGLGRITGTLGSIAEAQTAIAAAVQQQRSAADRAADSVSRAAAGSARITEAVAELAEGQREAYVRRALARAEELVERAGGVSLAGGTLLLGGVPVEPVADPARRAPLVDDVVAEVGGSCTLFRRADEAGTMVRVATSVVTAQGRRNVGTAIAPVQPDGTPNPVLAAVLAGRTYTGPADVAGRPYFTAYAPLSGPDGALVGVLYVGLPLDEG
jgi:methyl-accepting chemotaxis protein